jgi:hypothetical protein
MGIDAFVWRYDLEGYHFAFQFLVSPDFDVETLNSINRDLGKSCSKPKNELADHTALEFKLAEHQQEFAPGTITDQ